jgi:hypothetical protein
MTDGHGIPADNLSTLKAVAGEARTMCRYCDVGWWTLWNSARVLKYAPLMLPAPMMPRFIGSPTASPFR